MAKLEIKEFNYITAGKTQNSFNLGYCYTDDGNISRKTEKPAEMSSLVTQTFFGNVGEYDSMSEKYNSDRESFYDINNKMIIHNMYPIQKMRIQSTSRQPDSDITNTDRKDIITPIISSDFIKMCQFQNYSYGLSKPTSDGPIFKTVKYNAYKSPNDYSYNYTLSGEKALTYLYTPPDKIFMDQPEYLSYDEVIRNNRHLSSEILSTIFQPYKNLNGIEYNYFVEIPEYVNYNYYDKGYIMGDVFVAKNHLNYLYSMEYNDDVIQHFELEYVYNTSGLSVDLGCKPTHHVKTQIMFKPLDDLKKYDSVTSNSFFYGMGGNIKQNNDYRIFNYNGILYFDIKDQRLSGDQFEGEFLKLEQGQLYELEFGNYYVKDLKNGGKYYSNNEHKLTYFDGQKNLMWLNGRERAELYYIKIYEYDELVKYFIPVKECASGRICLYDFVSKEYFYPKGSNFVSGPQKPVSQLKNCRDYCNIDVCGNELYATYRTNVNYSKDGVDVSYFGAYEQESDGFVKKTQDNMTKVRTDYSYQHVEIIESIHKWDANTNNGHKSSMFSLRLKDTGLNQSTISENVKTKLRQNIKNSIRTVLENITPANTQLFNIYFEGK